MENALLGNEDTKINTTSKDTKIDTEIDTTSKDTKINTEINTEINASSSIFGNASIPRVGIHSIRLCDVAIMDVLFTAVAAVIISKKHFISTFIILILLSIIIHTILGIKTRTNTWLL